MSFTDTCRGLRCWLAILAGLILAVTVGLTGCSTGRPDSDIPWNTPQRWEGIIPAMPSGFPQQ